MLKATHPAAILKRISHIRAKFTSSAFCHGFSVAKVNRYGSFLTESVVHAMDINPFMPHLLIVRLEIMFTSLLVHICAERYWLEMIPGSVLEAQYPITLISAEVAQSVQEP